MSSTGPWLDAVGCKENHVGEATADMWTVDERRELEDGISEIMACVKLPRCRAPSVQDVRPEEPDGAGCAASKTFFSRGSRLFWSEKNPA